MDLVTLLFIFMFFGGGGIVYDLVNKFLKGREKKARLAHDLAMRELEVREKEAEAKLVETKLLAGAPAWLDPNNPDDVEAWSKTRKEMAKTALQKDKNL